MKIKIARDELLTGLQRVQGIVEKRNTMPVLSNILLETKQDGIELVATDLEIGIRGHYKAEVSQPGSVSLCAQTLRDPEGGRGRRSGIDDAGEQLGADPGRP